MKKFETLTDLEILHYAYQSILAIWVKEIDRKDELIANNLTTNISDARLAKLNARLEELHAEILKLEQGPRYVELFGKVYEVYEQKERTTVLMGGDGFTIEITNKHFATLTPLTEADISR